MNARTDAPEPGPTTCAAGDPSASVPSGRRGRTAPVWGKNMVSHRRGLGHRRPTLRTTRRTEEGNALLITLVFVIVISIVLSAVIGYATTNARVSKRLQSDRRTAYAADAAMDSAINWARNVSNVGRDPGLYSISPTGEQACTYVKPASGNTPAITVTCAAASGSGSGRTPENGTFPAQAILTLGERVGLPQTSANVNYLVCGTSAEDGLRTKAKGLPNGSQCDTSKSITNAPVTVRGDVMSKSTIKVDGSPLELYPLQNGTVTQARSVIGCSGSVRTHAANSSTLSNACNSASTSVPNDPLYAHRAIVSAPVSVPSTCQSGVTPIGPADNTGGTFTSATALSNLFASPSCAGKWIWFRPGVYYFNFSDGNQSVRCGSPASTQYMATPEANKHEWCIGQNGTNNVHVVGGSPFNWSDTALPPAESLQFPQDVTADNPFGGNCDPDKAGVQFIFGGDSRLYVADGNVELCAGPDPTGVSKPRIAIYGIREQKFTTPAPTTTSPICPANGSWPDRCVRNLSNALAIDGQLTDLSYRLDCFLVCVERVLSDPVSIDFNNYVVPDGNIIDSVQLKVAYKTHANSTFCTPQSFGNDVVTFIGIADSICSRPEYTISGDGIAGGNACAGAHGLPYTVGDQLGTYAVEIKNCFQSNAALTNFRVSWQARAFSGCVSFFGLTDCPRFTDQLDGIEVIVKLRSDDPSAEHPADGCIVDVPNYNDGLGEYDCAVLKTDQINANPTANAASDFIGRTSIKGTIYAPSAAVDFSDNYAKYPLFQRGLIARHLKIGSYAYIGPRVNTGSCATGVKCEPTAHIADISPRPYVFPREVTFTSCVQGTGANNDADCLDTSGTGADKLMGTTKVIYRVNNNVTPAAANIPEIISWANYR